MPDNVGTQAQADEYFTATLLRRSQRQFGELLYQICEISGFTQGKLSREAKDECRRLMEKGVIGPEDPVGSMEQPTISKVMAGVQGPTYLQVYIWLRVIKAHFKSEEFREICRELHIEEPPEFLPKWEEWLWHLSTFVPPDELDKACEETENLKLIEIHKPLIVHKEERWDRAKRRSVSKGTKKGMKFSPKTTPPRDVAAASTRND